MGQRLISRIVLVRLNEERMGSTKVCLMPFLSIMYFALRREFRQFVFTARLVDFISQFTSEGSIWWWVTFTRRVSSTQFKIARKSFKSKFLKMSKNEITYWLFAILIACHKLRTRGRISIDDADAGGGVSLWLWRSIATSLPPSLVPVRPFGRPLQLRLRMHISLFRPRGQFCPAAPSDF